MVEIRAELKRLSGLMHDAGYVPHTTIVLHDVEEEEKVFHLCHHSENLAIAFGLLNTRPGTPLQIRKNLWVCEDCHTSTMGTFSRVSATAEIVTFLPAINY
jgi:hypothetical protein